MVIKSHQLKQHPQSVTFHLFGQVTKALVLQKPIPPDRLSRTHVNKYNVQFDHGMKMIAFKNADSNLMCCKEFRRMFYFLNFI